MLLSGAVSKPRTLNEMDFEAMKRHASTHDRIHGLSWQNRDSPRAGTSQSYNPRANGNPQGYSESQHMKWYPPASTPGIPPSNTQASQWYQQTSVAHGSVPDGGHSSGIMRLEDLQAQFGGTNRGGFNMGGNQGRGYYGQDRRSNRGNGGSGYYQGQYGRSGSGYGNRDNRW